MTDGDEFLGVSRTQQLAAIAAVGAVLIVLSYSAVVDESTAPTVFGVGLVALGYAVVAGVWDLLR